MKTLNERIADLEALDGKRAKGNWYVSGDGQALNVCEVDNTKTGWDSVLSDYALIDSDEAPNIEPEDLMFIAAAPTMMDVIREQHTESQKKDAQIEAANKMAEFIDAWRSCIEGVQISHDEFAEKSGLREWEKLSEDL